MAFLGSILPSIAKFGTSVLGDIASGRNVGQSLKARGLESIRNIPGVGGLLEPLAEKGIEKIEQRIQKKRPFRRFAGSRFGARLNPVGRQMAGVMAQNLGVQPQTSPEEKQFRDWQKWARDFIKDQVDAGANNKQEAEERLMKFQNLNPLVYAVSATPEVLEQWRNDDEIKFD
jgi:hypothetical protein